MRASKFCFLAMVATFALAVPPIASAANWITVTESEAGTTFFIDTETMLVNGTVRKVWVKMDFSKNKSEVARTAMGRYEFDCPTRRYKLTSITRYKADGSVYNQRASTYSTFEEIAPESVAEAIFNVACNIENEIE